MKNENKNLPDDKQSVEVKVNFIPFVCKALAVNYGIHKDIDKLFQKNKIKYIESAKSNIFIHHEMIIESSLIVEDYYKKALGIASYLNQIYQTEGKEKEFEVLYFELNRLLKKGFPIVINYLSKNKEICLREFFIYYEKKNKNVFNTELLNVNISVLLFLSLNDTTKTLKQNTELEKAMLMFYTIQNPPDESASKIKSHIFSRDERNAIKKLIQIVDTHTQKLAKIS